MSRFAIRATPERLCTIGRWNCCGLRFKSTRSKKKSISSQDSQDLHITESSIYCPLINHNKSTDQEAMLSFLLTPLSLKYASKKLKGGERIYLETFPSVTSILSQTKPASEIFALKNWRKAQISELGKEQFKKKKKTISARGTLFHQGVQVFYKNNETPSAEDQEPNKGYWQSISHVLQDIKNVVAIESSVIHPLLGYGGTLDLIAEYKGALSVIDWKTSAKHKTKLKHCYSYPQQVVAYAGAVNFDNNYPFQVCDGVLVIAYENGDPADVHHLSQEMCETYWREWLMRLQQYREKFPEHIVYVGNLEENVRKQGNNVANVKENGMEQEVSLARNMESMAASEGAKSLSSLGVPVAQLGTIIKDEDLIEEKELSSKDHQQQLPSQEQSEGLNLWTTGTWKTVWKNILERLRFRGKK